MSFHLKLNKVNFTCAPLLTESFNRTETIGYMCKSNRTIEGFNESVPEYDNGKVYQLGNMVTKDGVVYKMIDGIGAPGYPPPRPTNWEPQTKIVTYVKATDAKVTFFVACDYQGESVSLGPGRYDIGQMGIPNDRLSSIRIPSGLKVTIFEHGGFQGRSLTMTADESCLLNRTKDGLNFNDQASSIIIEKTSSNENVVAARSVASPDVKAAEVKVVARSVASPEVKAADAKATFFVACDYQGESVSLGPGRYDIGQMGIPNDRLSSIKIPSGLKVTIYEHGGFQGKHLSMIADEPCLLNRTKDGLNFNDQASSIFIEKTSSNENLVKFVRVDGGKDFLQISQLVVRDQTGSNIAKGRKTTSSGVGSDGHESNAVDGVEASRAHPAEYHSSAWGGWFQVELTEPSKVVSVTIYNRADYGLDRMASGYRVKLLNEKGQVMVTSNPLNGEAKQEIRF